MHMLTKHAAPSQTRANPITLPKTGGKPNPPPQIDAPCPQDGRKPRHRRKALKCPYCKALLSEMGGRTKIELRRLPAGAQAQCQLYLKCRGCRGEVGLNIA